MAASTGVGRWTRWFTLASAGTLVLAEAAPLLGVGRVGVALVGIFGVVCPMIFGMAYLLFPSYVGRTLAGQRFAGLHFFLAYLGAVLVVAARLFGPARAWLVGGTVAWSSGVAVFVGVLLWTVVLALVDDPGIVFRSGDRPQRSSRLSSAAIPVAVGYLVAGTVVTVAGAGLLRVPVTPTLPTVLHLYGAGLGALLIYALGLRLMTGFFHVSPPRAVAWIVLVAGGVAPGVLTTHFWAGPLFRLAATLQATAMVGYGLLVGYVFYRTERRRVGIYGVLCGGIFGIAGVAVATLVAFDGPTGPRLAAHAVFVLDGFLVLTIVGYAFQFFPVTAGRFRGASDRTALGAILLLATGVAVRGIGTLYYPPVESLGTVLSLSGAGVYCYLIWRRLIGH